MSQFRAAELYTAQGGKQAVLFSGRLRVLHEKYPNIAINTQIVKFEAGPTGYVVIEATVTVHEGEGKVSRTFTQHGTASMSADAKLADSLIELAETRAVSRAARVAGVGVEFNDTTELSRNAGGGTLDERHGNPNSPSRAQALEAKLKR